MKKLTIFSSIAVAALAMVGCQEKEIETFQPGNEGSTFELIAEIAQTKTTLDAETYKVAWEEDDVIYMVTSGADTPWATAEEFTYADGKFNTESTIDDGTYTMNALYAVADQAEYHKNTGTTHKLQPIQTQDCANPTAHIKANDALVGTFTTTVPSDEPATVNMNHIYTLMQVDIKNTTGAEIKVTKFEMTAAGADLAGIFYVNAFDTPAIAIKSGASESITVNVTDGTVADGGSLPVYFIMAPLADYSGEVTFKVTDLEGNTYSKTVTLTDISFAAGTYNTTSYTISTADPKVQLANPLTSNVFVYMGDNSYKETANVNGISDVTTYKVGKSGAPGLASIVLPAGTSKIGFYAVSWKDKAAEFVIKSGEDEIAAFNPSANAGASNSSPYTMEVSDEDYYEFVFPETLGQESEYTLTTNGTNYRVIFWGINYYTTSGIGENQVERSISPTIYCNNNTVTIIAADGAKIYYTCDGSTPSESSALYADPFEIDATTTVKAIAIEDDKPRSKVVSMDCVYVDPNAGGGSGTASYTLLFGSNYNSKKVGSYTDSWSATNNGFTCTLANWNNNNNGWSYVKAGRKSYASVATITTNDVVPEALTTVTMTVDAVTASKINSLKLYVSTAVDFSTKDTYTATVATGNVVFNITNPVENAYYKIEVDCASGSSNGLITVSKIVYEN